MATTTETEKYAVIIEIHDGNTVSPHTVGQALAAGMASMPDDTMDWVFENGTSSYQVDLFTPYATEPSGPVVFGTATIYPISTEVEADRVATAITMGLDEFDEDENHI